MTQTQLLCTGAEIAINYLMECANSEIRQPEVSPVFIPDNSNVMDPT